ncbi:hypothetical protein EZ428_18090 [Pedobacter frigiditerrae]|uniref:Uncharacterized protein n=1 Tax=Pedobacter frigiditerrae TaxID=2530452 RepID=A0A4R0MQK7_9SPHI|nr:hypothetical protein [Pedobacter frigiditerrae]TCC88552.1 hypothetical protein EZ428_18090 [Pedobacter frigiditerrae]
MKNKKGNERRVVKKIAQVLRLLDSLEKMELPKHDAFEVQLTKGLLMGIIEYAGFRSKYHWLFGIRLLRAPSKETQRTITLK